MSDPSLTFIGGSSRYNSPVSGNLFAYTPRSSKLLFDSSYTNGNISVIFAETFWEVVVPPTVQLADAIWFSMNF